MRLPSDPIDEVCALMGSLLDNMEQDVFDIMRAGAEYDRESNVLHFFLSFEDLAFTGENYKILLRLSELADSIHFLGSDSGDFASMSVVFSDVFDLSGEEADAGE